MYVYILPKDKDFTCTQKFKDFGSTHKSNDCKTNVFTYLFLTQKFGRNIGCYTGTSVEMTNILLKKLERLTGGYIISE